MENPIMKSLTWGLIGSALALAAGSPALAHHSFAMFDLTKEVTVQGEIKEFQWTNPHVWIEVLVPDGKGGTQEWGVEAGAPGMLTRTGWKSGTLKPGDKVTLVMHPLRSGASNGSLVKVTLADGRVMGPGGAPPPPPAAKPAS
jgi:hypothetical protein